MNYAIIEISGKQFKVTPGQHIVVDRLEAKEGDTINLDKVLLTVDGTDIKIGTPTVSEAKLSAKVLKHSKGEKIRVATYKSKSRYRRVKGHRQHQTELEIVASKKAASKAK
jgi:large subunit ribosomal protein L21